MGIKATRIAMTLAAAMAVPAICLASPAKEVPIDLTVPAAALDFDDGLDARDAEGRPVRTAQAADRLRGLFVSSLYALLTRPDLPRVAEVLAVLNGAWDYWSGALRHAASAVWQAFIAVWCPPDRRYHPPVLFLVFVFSLFTFHFSLFTAFAPRLIAHLERLTCTVIRR